MADLNEVKPNATVAALFDKVDLLNDRLANDLEKMRDLRINVTGSFPEPERREHPGEHSRVPPTHTGSIGELETKLQAAHIMLTEIEEHRQAMAAILYYIPKGTVSG